VLTRVGQRGEALSVGERQLVAIARAYIADPDVLVLDEATSAVDPATEVRLTRALDSLTRGRTTLIIAHRLATAENADEILVVDAGRVVQRGPHAELVTQDGPYAAAVRVVDVAAAVTGPVRLLVGRKRGRLVSEVGSASVLVQNDATLHLLASSPTGRARVPLTRLHAGARSAVPRCPSCSPRTVGAAAAGRGCSAPPAAGSATAGRGPSPIRTGRRREVAAFATAVRAAIAGHGLPLRDLADELVCAYPSLASGVATLSAWQSGSSAPPRTVVGRDRVLALERVLGLPLGELALRMPGGPVVPAPRPPTPAQQDGPAVRRARLAHLVGAFGGSRQMLVVSLTKEVLLDPAGRPLCARVAARVRALQDGVDRLWYVDGDEPRLRPLVTATSGCRPLRRVPERAGPVPGLVATELVLDRTLALGERYGVSFLVSYDPRGARCRCGRPSRRSGSW
jgi:hypothetical protein